MDAINHDVMIVMVRVFAFMVMVDRKINVKLAASRHPIPSVSVVRERINALNATLPHLTSVNCVVLVSGSAMADALTVISYW